MRKAEKNRLAAIWMEGAQCWQPPEDITVDQWADRYRQLESGLSAIPGQWDTSLTEYMREPMRACTDPSIEEITVASPSQVGKSELELNFLGYIISQDPGTVLYIHPTKDDAQEFSRLRLDPMIKSTPCLKERFENASSLGRKATDTIMSKKFPGGMISFVGSNSPSGLSSKPCRYIIGDELDRWAQSAGRDGDPWMLATKRQTTFFNRKRIAVSTPTIKGASQIEFLYYKGTQERYKSLCPHCGAWHEIKFDDIRFKCKTERDATGRENINVTVEGWRCPSCLQVSDEITMKQQPARWEADHPENKERNKARSFWLNGFVSPFRDWLDIVKTFLMCRNDHERLKAFKNTDLGELWEINQRGLEEAALMERAEPYPLDADIPGEAGDGVLMLTCGVDWQHSYCQYEVVGWDRRGQSWGLYAGQIAGSPDSLETWAKLDVVLTKAYTYTNGKSLTINATFIDSGDGNYTNAIAEQCRIRQCMSVYAIKGSGTTGRPFTSPPTRQAVGDNKAVTYWLYTLGVNAGKFAIMECLKRDEPGANYCHFPDDETRGYDFKFYAGLLSEAEITTGTTTRWEKLPGHERNEALDCRNYARAAYIVTRSYYDFDKVEAALKGITPEHKARKTSAQPQRRNRFAD